MNERATRPHSERTPEPERHEGAITEPIDGQPLSESTEHANPPPHPISSRSTDEPEPHEGTITEPEEDQVDSTATSP